MIFQLVQKNLIILGISRNQSIYAFYVKVFIGFLLLGSGVFYHFEFIFRNDLTFEEYAESLYMTTISVMSFLCYVIMILIKDNFFKHIDKLDSIIQQFNESESKCYSLF